MWLRSKQRLLTFGRVFGGCCFGRGALYHLLKNRIYRGEVVHRGTAYPGEHKAIVDEELWNAVQKDGLVRRTGAGFCQEAMPKTGAIWLSPAGVGKEIVITAPIPQ